MRKSKIEEGVGGGEEEEEGGDSLSFSAVSF